MISYQKNSYNKLNKVRVFDENCKLNAMTKCRKQINKKPFQKVRPNRKNKVNPKGVECSEFDLTRISA